MKVCVFAAATCAMTASAFGQGWIEFGDAGDAPLTSQVTQGRGDLTFIGGTHAHGDVDMYAILINDPQAFSATTAGGATFDTQLWLFDANGRGVVFNDDIPGGGTLLSHITGQFVPAPGLYHLAISRYTQDPVDGAGQALWMPSPFAHERQPDGPGAANPIHAWVNQAPAGGAYWITLTGASHAVPTPGALALLAFSGLAAVRRRR